MDVGVFVRRARRGPVDFFIVTDHKHTMPDQMVKRTRTTFLDMYGSPPPVFRQNIVTAALDTTSTGGKDSSSVIPLYGSVDRVYEVRVR